MEDRLTIQHMDKASRIAAAFDSHVRGKSPREAIAVFQEIFGERDLNRPHDRDSPALPYNRVHKRYSGMVFLNNFHIRRVRLWCERHSIGAANNLPLTGMGYIPEEVWDRLRRVETRVGFYHRVYGEDRHRAASRYEEVMAASQRSPPLVWLALTQHEKEAYLEMEPQQ
ncbi:hypothetical protein [Medusavirus stheno T3]|uniref:Uncharacterized protein n=1 Tax=Medusavirus stheno T3 TaxID=3069717 RepID=A0A7S7YEM9_9VIRU|nr:hypothetical protein QKU73_gp387 [Acanthamoeba castellanii medusavirus]QPB44388.1 hypothetical protein [Medusavirus stheno T3]